MRFLILLMLLVLGLGGCMPGNKIYDGLVGKDTTYIKTIVGAPKLTWRDVQTGQKVWAYTRTVQVVNPVVDVSQPPPFAGSYRNIRLLYLDKDGICTRWKKM